MIRIERFFPCPRRELWRALIQHAEIGKDGALLRLALPGDVSPSVGKITVYESGKRLECARDLDILRWELHERGDQTLLVFTAQSHS